MNNIIEAPSKLTYTLDGNPVKPDKQMYRVEYDGHQGWIKAVSREEACRIMRRKVKKRESLALAWGSTTSSGSYY